MAYDFDRTQILNLVGGLPLARNWDLGLRGQYQSGRPTTTTAGYNAGRNDGYWRFDLRIDKRALRESGAESALAKLKGARSMEAAVARACLVRAADGVAAVEERKEAAIEEERGRHERRLAFLGTLGNNAPFVGLFGTVLGIIRAFHDLAGSSMQGTQAVMAGIAEALVATGVGLLVALPAVAAYNLFTRRVERAVSASEVLAHEILAVLKSGPAPSAAAEKA